VSGAPLQLVVEVDTTGGTVPPMASGNAKRRQERQSNAQHRADKSHRRDHDEPHHHLPKVGTAPEQEHLRRQRLADLVDFGRVKLAPSAIIGVILFALLALVSLLVLFA
jgi:hypothetical protein